MPINPLAAPYRAIVPLEGTPSVPTTAKANQFSLVKGAHRYLVRCRAGGEDAAIAQLIAWADDNRLEFDWFDAAVLARQVTQRQLERTVGRSDEA